MKEYQGFHQSISRIPPERLMKYPLMKQSIFSNMVYGKILKRFGIMQMMSFHKIRKKTPKATFPYMPHKLPENAYLYDFHFHSYYSDGRGTFKDILLEINRKKHLNGLAITDHPYHLSETSVQLATERMSGATLNNTHKIPAEKVITHSYEFQNLIDRFKKSGKFSEDFISFPGSCEFFTKLEDDDDTEVELIVLGVSKDFVKKNGGIKRLTNYCHAVELIEKVHDDNGLVIIPHPFFFTRAHKLFRFKLSRNSRPDAIEALNYTTGFIYDEAYHGFLDQLPFSNQTKIISHNFGYFNWMATIISQENNYGKYFDYPLAREVARVGSSDAHFHNMIGAAATMINEPIHSIEDLRRVFRKRETTPILNPIWSQITKRSDVFNEIIEAYGDLIMENFRKQSSYRWLIAKIIVDLFALLFD